MSDKATKVENGVEHIGEEAPDDAWGGGLLQRAFEISRMALDEHPNQASAEK